MEQLVAAIVAAVIPAAPAAVVQRSVRSIVGQVLFYRFAMPNCRSCGAAQHDHKLAARLPGAKMLDRARQRLHGNEPAAAVESQTGRHSTTK